MQLTQDEWAAMPKAGRRELLAGFLRDAGWVAPPAVIQRNFQLDTGLSISYKTTRRYLQELAEMGELRAVAAGALDEAELRDPEPGETTWFAPA